MANGINITAPQLRDALLARNLAFSDSITNAGYTSYAAGIGLPTQISHSPEAIIQNENLLDTSVNIRKSNILKNQYLPTDIQSRLVNIDTNLSFFTSQSRGGYLDKYGNIKGTGGNQGIDTISGLLTGAQTLDIRSSLASRILTSTGVIDDTELGIIGNRELINAMKAKALFNARRETLGQLNLNPINLLMGQDFINPDYSITIPSTTGGQILDVGLNILGFESPILGMDPAASIFDFELYGNDVNVSDYLSRNNARIKNTGKGQVKALFKNLSANLEPRFSGNGIRYTPGYTDDRLKPEGVQGDLYVVYDKNGNVSDFEKTDRKLVGNYSKNIISNVPFSWNTTGDVDNFFNDQLEGDVINQTNRIDEPNVNTKKGGIGMLGANNTFEGNDWLFNNKNTLLGKTQALFDNGKIRTLLGNKGMTVNGSSELESTETQGGDLHMISKGSAVKYIERSLGSSSDNPNDVFCRSWVNYRSYNQVGRLQKHSGLNPKAGIRFENYKESVLDDNGFIRFGPYNEVNSLGEFKAADIKRYMFSLENLAWNNDLINLPKWEQGPGDLITGTKGRIMWFPPYDLNFSESVSVGLDSTTFIGRGEPVYTYNNTERTGNISFKVIMDHPNYLNEIDAKKYSVFFDDLVNSITAGCGDIPDSLSVLLTKEEENNAKLAVATKNPILAIDKQKGPEPFKIYFPNDVASLEGGNEDSYSEYEILGSMETPAPTTWKATLTEGYTPGITTNKKGTYEDRFNYGLNKLWRDEAFINELRRKLKEECPSCRIKLDGYASTDGVSPSNDKLSVARAKSIADFFRKTVLVDDVVPVEKRFERGVENGRGHGQTGSNNKNEPVDHINKKIARYVNISFVPDPTIDEINKKEFEKKVDAAKQLALNNKIKSRFFNESLHFQKLKLEDPLAFNSLKDKIKFFHPAFHSITPEGFNSRLTFLHQCTRQGSTTNKEGRPDNLSFGMAPVCILRLGDFYHTKIMIESMNIDYENTWDLNPEGVGVQPMIATVTLTFKFIGGQSMQGPINRLQNAVAFNFFANSEIFDPRADKIVIDGEDKKPKYVKGITNLAGTFTTSDEDKPGVTTNLPTGDINQDNVAEASNAEQSIDTVVSGTTEVNNVDVISAINYVNFFKVNLADEGILIRMNFTKKVNVNKFALDTVNFKTYVGFISITDNNNVKKPIGYFRVRPNDVNSVVFISGPLDNNKPSSVNTEELILTIGESETTKYWDSEVIIADEELITFVRNASLNPGSKIEIKWDTGYKINANFSQNNSLNNV